MAYVEARRDGSAPDVEAEPAPDPVGLRARSALGQPGTPFPSRRR